VASKQSNLLASFPTHAVQTLLRFLVTDLKITAEDNDRMKIIEMNDNLLE